MKYCCEEMKRAKEKGIRDCYAVNFCPFCGAKLEGNGKSIKRTKKNLGIIEVIKSGRS